MRLLDLDENQLTPAQARVLKSIQDGPRGKLGLIGPFRAMVSAPEIGEPIQALGAAVRFNVSLKKNIQEVVICTVGAYFRSKFEFSAHQHMAIRAGVNADCLDQLRRGEVPKFYGEEKLAYELTTALLTRHRLTDNEYAAGRECFSETGMIELVATIGYYSMISLTLNTFEIPLEPGMTDPFPEDT